MRFKQETRAQRLDRISKMRMWFAWYPVYYKGQWFWLEKVQCRYRLWIAGGFMLGDYGWWEYYEITK